MTDFIGFRSELESRLVACTFAPLIVATGYSVFLAAQATHWEERFVKTAVALFVALSASIFFRLMIANRLLLPPKKRTTLNQIYIFAILTSVGLSISAALTLWPMRWTFHGCRSQMELLANQVESGTLPAMPVQVGPFLIADGYVEKNKVNLWLPNGHRTEWRQFVRASYAESRSIFPDALIVDLGNGWCFIE